MHSCSLLMRPGHLSRVMPWGHLSRVIPHNSLGADAHIIRGNGCGWEMEGGGVEAWGGGLGWGLGVGQGGEWVMGSGDRGGRREGEGYACGCAVGVWVCVCGCVDVRVGGWVLAWGSGGGWGCRGCGKVGDSSSREVWGHTA